MGTEMRRKDRAITERSEIEQIIEAAKILHLGLFDGEFPYVVPLHYGFEYEEASGSYVFYLHGAREGHKLDLIRSNQNVCLELETDVELASGGEVPCNYGSYYSSFMGKGKASILSDPQEKLHGLQLLMRNQTGRDFAMNEQMAAAVAVIRVEVTQYTAKAKRKM